MSLNLSAIYPMFYLFVTVDTSYPSCLQLLPSSCLLADVGGTAEINPFTSDVIQISTLTLLSFFMFYYERQMGFSYFEFKIRLIRLYLSFEKKPEIHVF